jgi:hypothetical protein
MKANLGNRDISYSHAVLDAFISKLLRAVDDEKAFEGDRNISISC